MPTNNETNDTKSFKVVRPNLNNYFVNDPNVDSRLRSYLGRVKTGSSKIVTTPWLESRNVPDSEILSQFSKILDEWKDHLTSLNNDYPGLFEHEMDMADKSGPLSVQKPLKERIPDIESYYELSHGSDTMVDQRAIKAALTKFPRGVRVKNALNTWAEMKKSTSAGSPLYGYKRRDVANEITSSRIFANSDVESIMAAFDYEGQLIQKDLCAMIGWRGQEGGTDPDDVKQRVVWMFPAMLNLAELRAYQPLTLACQKANAVPAWVSSDAVDLAITGLLSTKGSDDYLVCTDFTKFDQHFNSGLQDTARNMLLNILNHDDESMMWLGKIFDCKYYIPMLVAPDTMYTGRHGMGSGSGGTNFDETLVHTALQYEAAITAGQRLNNYSMCLGDDGVLTYPGIDVDHVIDTYTSHGLEMNKSKQYVSKTDCIYLRRWHSSTYAINGVNVGVYPTTRALGRLCFMERWYSDWSPIDVALRELSILENCKWHPLREEFVKFCMRRDKYRLGLDIPGFFENIQSYAQEAMDRMPDFLGYNKTQEYNQRGIRDWWVVRYLSQLA